ncbi:hypothetical protein [Herbiconiux sp. A18JL235]|uniref:Uncharacterized protein n=1 Tax=Herbiconiux sp. A18JL235 TaxID=3152363 RepID=A0AB39BEN7_9MICO
MSWDDAQLSRRTLIGTVWAAPVVLAAVAAPLAAASTNQRFTATPAGPYDVTGPPGTLYYLDLVNDGTTTLAPRAITAIASVDPDRFTWYGPGGLDWDEIPSTDPTTVTLTNRFGLAPGTFFSFYFLAASTDRSASPTPDLQLTFLAPGYEPLMFTLAIPY